MYVCIIFQPGHIHHIKVVVEALGGRNGWNTHYHTNKQQSCRYVLAVLCVHEIGEMLRLELEEVLID